MLNDDVGEDKSDSTPSSREDEFDTGLDRALYLKFDAKQTARVAESFGAGFVSAFLLTNAGVFRSFKLHEFK